MYDRFKNALDDFTEKNQDVCTPVETAIDAMHRLLQDLGPAFAELEPLAHSSPQSMSDSQKMRYLFMRGATSAAHQALDQLLGATVNAANINDLARRSRGKLIVAKGVFDGKARD